MSKSVFIAVAAIFFSGTLAFGQVAGPDVIVGSIPNISNYSSQGGVDAISIGTTSCNVGTSNLLWIANTSEHPVIGQHAYRLLDNRFEMIGQSWLKHGFTALTQNLCDTCSGVGGSVLGVGCSDPYGSGLNGSQGGLGPKFEVNAYTGVFPYPFSNPNGSTGNSIFKRLQMKTSELGAAGAQYFVEAHYVTEDDASFGNQNNNASWRQMTISGGPSNYNFSLTGNTVREEAAIYAWQAMDPTVKILPVNAPNDGRFHVAFKEIDNGNGTYDYEFAVHNLNSHRSANGFTVNLPAGATASNIGFHDVDYHSGEPFDGTDWAGQQVGDTVTWSTDSFSTNPDANALRWGTTYNFRFTADMPAPTATSLVTVLDLFRPGSPNTLTASFDPPNVLNVVSGDNQSSSANTPFPTPLTVQVTTPLGAPLAGIAVTFTPQNSICFVTGTNPVVTDANGFASVNVTAGSNGGNCPIVAATSDNQVVFNLNVSSFTATHNPGADVLVLQAFTGIPNLRFIVAADAPAGIVASNQYGDFYTSILNPGPNLIQSSGYPDLPNYDPSLMTNQSGILVKAYFGVNILNGPAVFQGYAVYIDGMGQLRVLVTEPDTVVF